MVCSSWGLNRLEFKMLRPQPVAKCEPVPSTLYTNHHKPQVSWTPAGSCFDLAVQIRNAQGIERFIDMTSRLGFDHLDSIRHTASKLNPVSNCYQHNDELWVHTQPSLFLCTTLFAFRGTERPSSRERRHRSSWHAALNKRHFPAVERVQRDDRIPDGGSAMHCRVQQRVPDSLWVDRHAAMLAPTPVKGNLRRVCADHADV